jgi:pimeloyl-ACP methyl ester carboxylesterase
VINEFELLSENAEELGLRVELPPRRRLSTDVGNGQRLSAIAWGDGPARLVFLHGGGQNAHTFDSVLLALGQPALAVDLPGHGQSDWRADHDYSGQANASAVAAVIERHAATPITLVGMSLGGLTAISLTSRFPRLVRCLLLVDVSPESATRYADLTPAQRGSVALIAGPEEYASFDDMLEATVQASPTRSRASLRRGVLYNAMELASGRWTWRYDKQRKVDPAPSDTSAGWNELSSCNVPLTLVRGALSGFVQDDDVTEMLRRKPDLAVHVVDGAGHSVQSDRPLELVEILQSFMAQA